MDNDDGDQDTATTSTGATSTISSTIQPRVGFHFSCVSRFHLIPSPSCTTLQLQYSLPPDLLVDPYELDLHHHVYTYEMDTRPDLELPVFATKPGGFAVNLNIASDTLSAEQSSLRITLPLHARYGAPSYHTDPDEAYEILRFPQPSARWLCASPDGNPYSQHFLLDATIPDMTVFVPLAVAYDAEFVELGTTCVLLCMFAYLSRVFNIAGRRIDWQEREDKRE